MYPSFPPINPCAGSSSPTGSDSFTTSPLALTSVSSTGRNKGHRQWSAPSLSPGSDVSKSVGISIGTFGKITVKRGDDGIFRSGSSVWRFHWPIQGPQAFAIIVAPISSKAAIMPSRSAVARICSEPGLTISGEATFKFFSFTCRARRLRGSNPDRTNWYTTLSGRLPSGGDSYWLSLPRQISISVLLHPA